jgi:hypothetical protein
MRFGDSEHITGDERRVDIGCNVLQTRLGDGPVGYESRVYPRQSVWSHAQQRVVFILDGESHELGGGIEPVKSGGRACDTATMQSFFSTQARQ